MIAKPQVVIITKRSVSKPSALKKSFAVAGDSTVWDIKNLPVSAGIAPIQP